MNYKIYIKNILLLIFIFLICSLFNTTLYYFNITNAVITKIISLITIIISLIISGYFIGKKSQNKAYKNGLILSSIIITTHIILNLITNHKIALISIIYYLLIIIIVTTSSIIGINNKK